MADRSFRGTVAKVLRPLVAVIAPKTPRGRVRRAVVLILALLFFAGTYSYPKYWNDAALRVNERADAAGAPAWLRMPHFWQKDFRLGLDLQGGTHLVYVADMSSIPDSEHADSIAGVRDVIERRVNAFGVSEPLVQTNKSGDEWRLIVDLAGISDVNEAITLIGETPILEFKEENDQPARELTAEEQEKLTEYNLSAKAAADATLVRARASDADFEMLVSELSEDSGSKDQGGDLGFISSNGPYGAIVDAMYAANLAPGDVLNEVVQAADGFHVAKLEEIRDGQQEINVSHLLVCYAGLPNCSSDRTAEEAHALIADLKTQISASNFGTFATEHSDDPSAENNGGNLGWFGHGMMVPPFEEAAFALEKGAVSDIVESDFGFHLIYKIDERTPKEYRVRDILIATQDQYDYLPPADPWKNTELSGKHLQRSTVQFHPQTNEPQVSLEFNDEGGELFGNITERNVGRAVAIFLDGEPISIPTVNEAIHEGSAVISGNFTIQEAKLLARRLNAGALPVPIGLESQQSVGASLGNDSLDTSLRAGLIGFLVVALFMLLYYRLPGLIAIIALGIYTAINLAIYKGINMTLSLSGIAGLILSVGMAVDANILIFERLKEELLRGRSLGSAIDEGFRRAWMSIRDSNFTTLISSAILFYTSSSLIKGFALTLGIGVLVSMFSAITVSRTLLRLVSGWKLLRNESLYLPGLHVLKRDDNESN